MHSVLMCRLHVFRALAPSSTCFSAYVFDVGTAIPRQRDKAICLCPPLRSMESREFWTAGTLRGQPGRCPCCCFLFSDVNIVILCFVGNLDFGSSLRDALWSLTLKLPRFWRIYTACSYSALRRCSDYAQSQYQSLVGAVVSTNIPNNNS